MSIGYQFGDVDAHGATIRAQAAALEAEHRAEQANAHGQKVQPRAATWPTPTVLRLELGVNALHARMEANGADRQRRRSRHT